MTFKVTVKDKGGAGIGDMLVTANDEMTGESFSRSTDGNGYADVAMLGQSHIGDRVTLSILDPQYRFKGTVLGDALVTTKDDQVLEFALDSFKRPSALPTPPTRDEIIDVALTFQGLIFYTEQFGKLPGFEACLPWLTPSDRQVVYAAKHNSASIRVDKRTDTHCIVVIPDGPPLYDEPGQAYSPDKFGPLDWTDGNTVIDHRVTDLLCEVIKNGFNKIILYLGGDGGGDSYKIAFKQLDLLYANEYFRTTLYKYCVVIPGWDGVFYGWPLEQVMLFGARFRELFPDGHLGLHYSTGHIPVGEGGEDYDPRPAGGDIQQNPGRMADYDLTIGEFGGTEWEDIHCDSTWQILNRMEPVYIRPADQPAGDDVERRYYLGTPNPRGRWGHFVMEFDEYKSVRCGDAFEEMVAHSNNSRAYMGSMGAAFIG